jgi:hypothetical protein
MANRDAPPEMRRNAAASGWIARVGADWWATILGLAITGLAVLGALPKIPW